MLFWKTEFCKSMPAEKFEKEHTYAIRHAYGKEGKRVDYTPHTCMKCISANPGPGEHHGCPYKTFGKEALSAALGGLKISARQVSDIVEKASGHHYQLACGMTFEAVHGAAIESGVQHPNQYFTESRKALGFGSGGDGSGSGSPEREPVTPGPLGSRLPLGGDSITPITARQ
jgi:DNA primase large subunit